jgi:hypothetical protein
MGHAATTRRPLRVAATSLDLGAIAPWLLAFSLVLYLSLSGGGYDPIVHDQVGVAIWWIVVVGALAGVVRGRFGWRGWTGLALLAAFAAWTAVGIGWSESTERSAAELGKVATYVGILTLALAVQRRGVARHAVAGVACAVGCVAVVAVASRLHPAWFPRNDVADFLPPAAGKLAFPLNYWNALAAMMALGMPLALEFAASARTLARQAAAAAVVPVMSLGAYLTGSRGAVLVVAVALLVYLALAPDRLVRLLTLSIASAGSVILVVSAAQRHALTHGLPDADALHQGDQMLALVVLVAGGVALLQVAISLAVRHGRRPGWSLVPGRVAAAATVLALVLGAVIGVGAGAPSWVGDRWREFKASPSAAAAASQPDTFKRLQSTSGNGRYQYWQAAAHAAQTDPWRGIGPGTFEFWWARHATLYSFVRDAHSLYLQTLAEDGIVGLALLGGFLLLILAAGSVRALRAPPGLRGPLAAATAGAAVFCASATFEWIWAIAALPAALLVLAGVILAGREAGAEPARPRAPVPSLWRGPDLAQRVVAVRRALQAIAPRAVVVALALAALAGTVVPLAVTTEVRKSQEQAAAGRLGVALRDAQLAHKVQRGAASPQLQRALVLEQAGDLTDAANAARDATIAEPTNWRTWLIRSRIEAERGRAGAAVATYRRARELNPRSTLFHQ